MRRNGFWSWLVLPAFLHLMGTPSVFGGDEAPLESFVEPVRVSRFVLQDQFDVTYDYDFPTNRPTVVFAADRKGYELLDPWITEARERWVSQATIIGVADLRPVPGFLRGKVKRAFQKGNDYPILLDWKGELLTQLDPEKHVPNIYLLDREGRVELRMSGQATTERLKEIQAALDAVPRIAGKDASLSEE
jgi:hypothetical protein